jgi:type I restriction enzyme S subunit
MNWKIIQFRYLFKITSGSTPDSGNVEFWDGNIPWVTPEDVSRVGVNGILADTRRKISEKGYRNSGTVLVSSHSIVLTKRAPIGQVAILGVEASSNQGCFLLTPYKNVYSRFYFYYLSTQKEMLHSLGRGSTFMELSTDDLKSLKVPFTQKENQIQIAAYLDRETARIDTLIAAKERLLTLLAEKRQALITRAVTRGLDPTVKMKDSGVEWLGEVPEEWEIKRIKHVAHKIGSGVTPRGGSEVYEKEGIPFLRSQNIHFSGLQLDDVVFISREVHDSMSNSKVEVGDVLLNITGASIGRCYYVDQTLGEANLNQHVCIVRPNSLILTQYLYYFLASDIGQFQISLNQTGGGREGLNFENLKAFIIPFPSIIEQEKILNYIEKWILKLNKLESSTERTIELLKERRSTVISAAVTGQIETLE